MEEVTRTKKERRKTPTRMELAWAGGEWTFQIEDTEERMVSGPLEGISARADLDALVDALRAVMSDLVVPGKGWEADGERYLWVREDRVASLPSWLHDCARKLTGSFEDVSIEEDLPDSVYTFLVGMIYLSTEEIDQLYDAPDAMLQGVARRLAARRAELVELPQLWPGGTVPPDADVIRDYWLPLGIITFMAWAAGPDVTERYAKCTAHLLQAIDERQPLQREERAIDVFRRFPQEISIGYVLLLPDWQALQLPLNARKIQAKLTAAILHL